MYKTRGGTMRRIYNSVRRTFKKVKFPRIPRMSGSRILPEMFTRSRRVYPEIIESVPFVPVTVSPPFVSSITSKQKNNKMTYELVLDKSVTCRFMVYSRRIFINKFNIPLTPDLTNIMYKEVVEFCGVNIPKYIRRNFKNYPYQDSDKQDDVNNDILNNLVFEVLKRAKENAKQLKIKVEYNSLPFPNHFLWDDKNIQTNWMSHDMLASLKENEFDVYPFIVIDNPVIHIQSFKEFSLGNLVRLHFGYVEIVLKARFVRNARRFLRINKDETNHKHTCSIQKMVPMDNADLQDDMMLPINDYENLHVIQIGSILTTPNVIRDFDGQQYEDYIEDELTEHDIKSKDLLVVIKLIS